MNGTIFKAMFVIVPILIAAGFIYTLAMIFSPKLRGKMMSRQIKAQKYMMEESMDDLRSISNDMAHATKGGISTTARAIRDGFSQGNIHCKHCGARIDSDSRFCKECGKEQ